MPVQNLGGFRLVDRRTVGAFSSCCWRVVARAVSTSSWRRSFCTISSCSWKRWVCASCSCCWRRVRPTSAPVPGEAGLAPCCAGDASRAPPAAAAGVTSGPPSPPGKLRSLFSCWTHFARALLLLLQVETLGSRLVFLLRSLLRTRVRAAATLPRRRLLVLEPFCEIVCLCLPIAGCRWGNYSVLAACSLEAGLEPPSAPVWCSLPTPSPLGDALRARSPLGDSLQAHWPLGRTLRAISHRPDVLRAPDRL
jgi:hypothetical protein